MIVEMLDPQIRKMVKRSYVSFVVSFSKAVSKCEAHKKEDV